MVHTAAAVIWNCPPVFAAVLAIRQRPACPRHFQNSFAYLEADSGQSPLIHSQVSFWMVVLLALCQAGLPPLRHYCIVDS